MNRIYLSAPDVRPLERELLNAAIDSNWIAPIGPDLDAFESEVATLTSVKFAVALSSGTAALHLALTQLAVQPGDLVVVPTFTFVASANAVAYMQAVPLLIDSDPNTWTLSPQLVEEELRARAATNELPRAAIVVDLYGQTADYDDLLPLFKAYEIPVVEDAAEALGATYRGKPAGSFGKFGILSFNGNKIITTSGGGMLLCNDRQFADRARHLATQAREPAPHYEHREIGFNYRLSNLLAALGRGQLATLGDRVERRRAFNARYREALSSIPGLAFMPVADYGEPNWWLTCITIDQIAGDRNVESLRQHLELANIESRPTWKPMHLQPIFRGTPKRVDGTSEKIFQTGLCLPSGSGMSNTECDFVIANILKWLESR